MPRATAGDEESTRPNQPQREAIQAVIAAQRGVDSLPISREFGWVEHDGIERFSPRLEFFQSLERILLDRLQPIGNPVEFGIGTR